MYFSIISTMYDMIKFCQFDQFLFMDIDSGSVNLHLCLLTWDFSSQNELLWHDHVMSVVWSPDLKYVSLWWHHSVNFTLGIGIAKNFVSWYITIFFLNIVIISRYCRTLHFFFFFSNFQYSLKCVLSHSCQIWFILKIYLY